MAAGAAGAAGGDVAEVLYLGMDFGTSGVRAIAIDGVGLVNHTVQRISTQAGPIVRRCRLK